MAKRTIEALEDHVDGSPAAETVTLDLDRMTYKVDLNDEHAADLREILAPYISVARTPRHTRVRTRRAPPAGSAESQAPGDVDRAAVRVRAKSHGIAVSDRGKVRAEVPQQFATAHR